MADPRPKDQPAFRGTDREYLRNEQYRNASNLNARMQLHERFSANPYGWHRWVFDQLELSPPARILELGCGPGALWSENLDRIPEGWNVVLSDFSPGMVDEARRRLRDRAPTLRFALADAQALPFAASSFDAIIANHMLYHVPNRARALSEIRRALRPGGRLYAATVGRDHMREFHDRFSRIGAGLTPSADPSSGTFDLENGRDELSAWFPEVTLHRYEDSLAVTEVEPLIAYALSGRYRSVLVGEPLGEFVRSLEQELAQRGAIRITKASGLFEARRE